jgi:hypothetical protein
MPQPPDAVLGQFVVCFEGMEGPRSGDAGLHDFHGLLVIALCTVLSGGQGATHMEAFAVAKFLRGFIRLRSRRSRHRRQSAAPFLRSRRVFPDTSGLSALFARSLEVSRR